MIEQGATVQQIGSWRQQNASRFAAQEARAEALAAASYSRPHPVLAMPALPSSMSQGLRDFLTANVTLANSRAQIHNALVASLPDNPSVAQVNQTAQQEDGLFSQQFHPAVQAQAARLANLGTDKAPNLPTSFTLHTQGQVDPAVVAFLVFENQLMQGLLQVFSQNVGSTPAAREAAVERWKTQNSSGLTTLRTMAQNLAQPGPPLGQ